MSDPGAPEPHRLLLPRILAACAAFLLVLAVVSPGARAAGLEAITYFQLLPDSNPYRDTLLRFESLPAETRDAIRSWSSHARGTPATQLHPEQLAIAQSIAADLRAAAAHPPLPAEAWPKIANPDDPDNPVAITLPGVGPVRDLARIAAKVAATLPPAEAIDTYAAIGQLGRQQRAGGTLIEQLTGVAIEGIAVAEASKRLNDLGPDDLQRLSAAWSALAPPPSIADAVAGERDLFFRPILERMLVPGLRAILADPQAGLGGAGDTSPDAGFTRDLRLCGLMNLGGGDVRIVLENSLNGQTITLTPNQPSEGIELVSIDFLRRLAVIRRGTREAVIHLEFRRIVERDAAATRLRALFGTLEAISEDGEDDTLATIVDRARRHPEGVDGYARDLLAAYQAGIDRQLALADSPRAPSPDEAARVPDDMFLAHVMPTIGRVARTLNSSATYATMLQAAIHHRLGQLGAGDRLSPPADPWTGSVGAPFTVEATPDGGFLLRSAYETAPGAPLTYKFAAPDAGVVRARATP